MRPSEWGNSRSGHTQKMLNKQTDTETEKKNIKAINKQKTGRRTQIYKQTDKRIQTQAGTEREKGVQRDTSRNKQTGT